MSRGDLGLNGKRQDLFLASDLSRAIMGTTVHVDGGAIAALGFID